jgi:hypothetical protein
MSVEEKEITINITRRILALSILAIIGFAAVWTYGVTLFAYITPNPDLDMRVNSVSTSDTSNNPKSSFNKGETARIFSSIEKATAYSMNYYYYYFVGGESYRLVFTVTDNLNRPVYFGWLTDTINPGQVNLYSSDYAIPTSASAGSYTVNVYIWSEFLPSGEALAPTGGSVTFTVT